MAEMLIRSYALHHGISCVILRLFNVYGFGQPRDYLIPYLLECAFTRRTAVVRSPESVRDFVYVSDVIDAMLRAAITNGSLSTFNVDAGVPRSIRQVIGEISKIMKIEMAWKQSNQVADAEIYATCKLIQEQLGWEPRMKFKEGLLEMMRSMK